jgi:hypothetical protein
MEYLPSGRADLVVVSIAGVSLLILMIETPPHFILLAVLIYTYIMQFSTCYIGYRS